MRRIPIPEWQLEDKKFIDYAISHYLDIYFNENKNSILSDFSQIIYYSTQGGKRIRAIFALELYLHFSNKKFEDIQVDDDIVRICVAIELLHSYSLIHDDLPCMDNDSHRRGELTTWKKYGETNAMLAGDFLNSLSFQILGSLNNKEIGYTLIGFFGTAVGFYGMIGGQVLDIHYENNPKTVTLEKLIETHHRKTGALITFSIIAGVMISGYTGDLGDFQKFGGLVGLAFQVKDDILDKEGTFEETGKSVGEEQKGFIELIGLHESEKYLNKLTKNALATIAPYNIPNIEFIVKYLAKRKR